LMDPMLEEFEALAGEISFSAPKIPVISNVTGKELSEEEATSPAYWASQVRQPVRFLDGLETLTESGASVMLELGPDPVLTAMSAQLDDPPKAFSLLRKGLSDELALTSGLFGAVTSGAAGAQLDAEKFFKNTGAQKTTLPTYAFQRTRYWLEASIGTGDARQLGLGALTHPLLGSATHLAKEDEWLLTGRISLATHPWLTDHRIMGAALFPGTGFAELALAAASSAGLTTIEELVLEAPLVIPEDGAVQIQVALSAPDEDGQRAVEIHSRGEAAAEDAEERVWVRNAIGTLSARELAVDAVSASEWPPPRASQLDTAYLYDDIADIGIEYGPAFCGITAAWSSAGEIFAETQLPAEHGDLASAFSIHPALLDACRHVGFLDAPDGDSTPLLPQTFSGAYIAQPGATSLRVHISRHEDALKITGYDSTGMPVIVLEKLLLSAVDAAQVSAARDAGSSPLLKLDWQEPDAPGESDASDAPAFVTVGDFDPEISGVQRFADLDALADALASESDLPRHVLLQPTIESHLDRASVAAPTVAALVAVQSWLKEAQFAEHTLVVITRDAVAATDNDAPDPAAAAVWGLLRSAQSEHPGRFILIDTDQEEHGPSVSASIATTLRLENEPQVAIRAGLLLVPRLIPTDEDFFGGRDLARGWRIDVKDRGALASLQVLESDQAEVELSEGQVRIAVRAAGISIRDVQITLGVYPDDVAVGSEAAGEIVERGPGVTQFEIGDRVMGIIPNSIASHAIADSRMIAKLPAKWTFVEGASMPVAFLTAYCGLHDLAALQPGERVVIDDAGSAVGTAAVQIAQNIGADVITTATTSARAAVESLGAKPSQIASSRTPGFKEKVLEVTHGKGVDVVFGALAQEFADASLDLLHSGGRFLQPNDTDDRDLEELTGLHPGIEYHAIDMTEQEPERIQEMLAELTGLFEVGALGLPATTSLDARDARHAIRLLDQDHPSGKIVLTIPRPVQTSGTVLITGGTGALGALVARHFAEHRGAEHLLLISRSGETATGAAELKEHLQSLGTNVDIRSCDAADREQLAALLGEISAEHPLTSVVHVAGVLDDGVLEAMSPERIEGVFAAKAQAAMNLHQLTKGIELEEFTLFSSAAGVL
ncbi:MAG: SDR family NAD(P)-dependent oxidoreductase, partial [Solirubrobacterales bacterium]